MLRDKVAKLEEENDALKGQVHLLKFKVSRARVRGERRARGSARRGACATQRARACAAPDSFDGETDARRLAAVRLLTATLRSCARLADGALGRHGHVGQPRLRQARGRSGSGRGRRRERAMSVAACACVLVLSSERPPAPAVSLCVRVHVRVPG